jgi:hypothetical protein
MPRTIVARLLAAGALLITASPALPQGTVPIASVQGSVAEGADGARVARDPATWAPWATVSTLTGIVPVNAARMTLTRR